MAALCNQSPQHATLSVKSFGLCGLQEEVLPEEKDCQYCEGHAGTWLETWDTWWARIVVLEVLD